MQEPNLYKTRLFDSKENNHYYHQWNVENPTAWVHIMHGMAEHSARYGHLAKFLNAQGISVSADDHRGHGTTGHSADSLYHIADSDGWNKLILDQWQLINHLGNSHDVPLIIMGHSMGSYMALRFCQRYARHLNKSASISLSGLILSGSGYTAPTLSRIARGLAFIERFRLGKNKPSPVLEYLSTGHFNRQFEPSRTPKDWLSSDDIVVSNYIQDPWCGGAISSQSWFDFLGGLIDIFSGNWQQTLPKNLPIYLFSGDLDPVGNSGVAVKTLRDKLLQADIGKVAMRLYPSGRHEMLNEVNRDEVYGDLLDWLKQIHATDNLP